MRHLLARKIAHVALSHVLWFHAAGAFDAITTYRSVQHVGNGEMNPLLKPVAANLAGIILAIQAEDVADDVIAKLIARRHPRIARSMALTGTAIHVGAAVSNMLLTRHTGGYHGTSTNAVSVHLFARQGAH